MNGIIPLYSSYEAFVSKIVEPRANQGWKRLDGETTGSTRRIAARFIYRGRRFKVDLDSTIEALIRPLELAERNGCDVSGVLALGKTRGGKGQKLRLKPEYGDDKGFFVYFEKDLTD